VGLELCRGRYSSREGHGGGTTGAGILLDEEREEEKSVFIGERVTVFAKRVCFVFLLCQLHAYLCGLTRLACPLSAQFFLSSSLLFSSTIHPSSGLTKRRINNHTHSLQIGLSSSPLPGSALCSVTVGGCFSVFLS